MEKVGALLLERTCVEEVYHELLLENAMEGRDANRASLFVEEFLSNTLCLLDLGLEQEAQTQLETAQFVVKQTFHLPRTMEEAAFFHGENRRE